MEPQNTKPTIENEERKHSFFHVLLAILVSSHWVIFNFIPFLPLGAIVSIYLLKPKKLIIYALIILASVSGFVGTGLHFTIKNQKRMNLETKEEYTVNKFNFGIRLGLGTIDYFQNKGKVIVYDDPSFEKEIIQGNKYVADFVKNYNNEEYDFMVTTADNKQNIPASKIKGIFLKAKEHCGDISSNSYMGYLGWLYPDQEYSDITVVHEVKFQKECHLGSIHFRLIFYPEEPKLTKIDFVPEEVKYRVVKGMTVDTSRIKKRFIKENN